MTQLFAQISHLRPFLVALYAFPILVLAGVGAVYALLGIEPVNFMRDTAQVVNARPYIGLVSNLGAFFWCAAGTICLLTWTVLRGRQEHSDFSRFILCSGLFTMVLMVDDFFMVHDTILPVLFGMSEVVVFVFYIVAMPLGMFVFRATIVRTEYALLFIALGLLALSIATDAIPSVIQNLIGNWRNLLEDGFKFLGIVGWFGYFSHTCFNRLKTALNARA